MNACCSLPRAASYTVLARRGAVVSNGYKNDSCLAAPPTCSLAQPQFLLRTAVWLFTNTQGSAKMQSLPKIGLTRGRSSPRKSLVKGERLVRYEEKPE